MIHSFVFAEGKLAERDMEISMIPILLKDEGVHVWLDLENPTPEETQQVLEKFFQFHPLSIEDCVTFSPLPKIEEYDGYLFCVIHAVDFDRKDEHFRSEELDLFLGRNFLVTWHREPLKSIQATLDRCGKRTQTARGSDRIAHAILDALVDNYLPVLHELGEDINEMETQIVEGGPQSFDINRLLRLKKEVLHLCQIIRPQLEVLNRFARGEFKIIRATLKPYYRDICDHLVRYNEMAQSFRDSLDGAMQLYLNLASNRTSEVVKVLTMFTVITTPVMVVGTWFGMNFKNMPELDAPWGYGIAVLVTLFFTAGTIIYFRRRGWM